MNNFKKIEKTDEQQSTLLSIIVTCFNSSETLGDTVESIVDVNVKNSYQILLINDGSADNGKTVDACKALIQKYEKFKNIQLDLVDLEKNVGAAEARNIALKHAEGVFITFADSDDVLDAGYLTEVFRQIEQNNSADVITFGITERYFQNNKQTNIVKFVPEDLKTGGHINVLNTAASLEQNTLFGYLVNKIYRASIIKGHNIKFEKSKLYEDTFFNILYWNYANKVVTVSKAFYIYNREESTSSSITHGNIEDYWELSYKKIERMYKWFYEEGNLSTKNLLILANEYVRYAFSALWRNRNKQPKFSKKSQLKWLDEFYKLKLTNNLLNYASPKGKAASKMAKALQSKNTSKVLRLVNVIDFVSNHMSWLLVRVRQSR